MDEMITPRGFVRMEWKDHYGEPCSLQKSSVMAEEECIWLGIDVVDCRMHLTQSMVRTLLPFLNKFVETGEL